MKKIKVLIVDDSALIRHILKTGLETYTNNIEIIGLASNPYIARDILVTKKPDVILLDVEMPKMDGISFLKKYMSIIPTPTIILSALTKKGKDVSIAALEAGAIDVMSKPENGISDNLPIMIEEIYQKILNASKANLKRNNVKSINEINNYKISELTEKIIVLGASTGGVEALARIVPLFPPTSPGIVIVEHMPSGFTKSFAERLDSISEIQVKEAEDGDRVRTGLVLIAPGSLKHTTIKRSGGEYRIKLVDGDPVSGHRPSVDMLFNSVAEEAGINSIGVIMTGMGGDGANGLLKIKESGGKTFAQDEKSCIIFGMPLSAIKLGAVDEIVTLMDIPSRVINCIK